MNIKEFNPSNIKTVEKSSKNIPIYYIGYVKMKIDLKILQCKSLYLIFDKVIGYFEEINGNNYLTLIPPNKSKEKIKYKV